MVESNWDTAPIILVPIFTGQNEFGHWSKLGLAPISNSQFTMIVSE
jgi:hypothetical protein